MPYFFTRHLFRFHRIPERRYVRRPERLEHLPKPPFILIANHSSSLDGYLLGAEMINFISTKVHFLGQAPRHGGWITRIIAKIWAELIFVEYQHRDRAVQEGIRYLRKGDIVVLFPEGKTNFDPHVLLKGKTGAARMAIGAQVPVVPLGILGGPMRHGISACRQWFREHPGERFRYVIGEPILLSEYYGKMLTYELLTDATRKLMQGVAQLTSREYPY